MSLLTSLFAMSDEQAMWRVQMHDDNQAFAQLLTRWEDPIQRLCTRMLGDEHKAQDMTQEAFTRVYARRKDFQHGSKFSTFLWRVAVNLCLDELRRLKRRREVHVFGDSLDSDHPEMEFSSEQPLPNDEAVTDEDARLVRWAVAQLPEHYRSVVILRHYEDLKFREIAEVLGVPEGTVKSRMAEALSILHQVLKKPLNDQPVLWKPGVISRPNSGNAGSARQQKEALAI
jgi:RNA polymerase sigma-70 factor (ECF subfamily)